MKKMAHYVLIGLVFSGAIFIQTFVPQVKVNKEFLKPPEKIKYFTFGYNDLLASTLWLRLVQNLDYCEGGKHTEADYVVPQGKGRERFDNILERKLKPSKCHLGWVYSMLNVISEIQPRFKLVYETGATFLSVAVDDREGAKRMFDKGLVQYPTDWQLYFRAGYHYMWEMQDSAKAAEMYQKAAQYGAPDYVVSLAAALYSRVGQAKIAKIMLEDALQKKPDGPHAERLRMRLEEINKILQQNHE